MAEAVGLGDQTDPNDFTNLWLIRHIEGLSRSQLSAQVALDVARLPDSVASTLSDQGVAPAFHRPSLLGQIFDAVGDRDGHLVPQNDLLAYQQRLQRLGYMAPDYTPTGQWDLQTKVAHRTLAEHHSEQIYQGEGGFGSSTPGKALHLLFNAAMPSHIARGIFGALKHLATSAVGSVARVGKLVGTLGLSESARNDFAKHWGEDLINVVTMASMFTGLGEALEAGRVGLGIKALSVPESAGFLGRAGAASVGLLEPTEVVAERLGMNLAKGAFELPAVNEMSPSLINRMARWGVEKVGGTTRADAFSEAWTKVMLPRRIASTNVGRVAGGVLGGAAKAAIIPQAVAIYSPGSDLGKAVNSAPELPWYVDLPVIVGAVHTPGGILPKPRDYMRRVGLTNFGHLDDLRGVVPDPHLVPTNVRDGQYLDVYAEHLANERVHTAKDRSLWFDSDGYMKPGALGEAKQQVVKEWYGDTFNDPRRMVPPEVQKAAREFALNHYSLRRARALDLFGNAQSRARVGQTGMNPAQDWIDVHAEAQKLQDMLGVHREDYLRHRGRVNDLLTERAGLAEAGAKLKDPGAIAAWEQRLANVNAELERAQIARDRNAVAVLYSEVPDSAIPTAVRVNVMRADSPDRQSFRLLRDRWNAVKEIDDLPTREAARAGLSQSLLEHGILPGLPDAKIAQHLDWGASHAAINISDRLPAHVGAEFSARNFKAVIGGHGVVMPQEVDPAIGGSFHFTRLARAMAVTGFNAIPEDSRDIFRLTNVTAEHALDDAFYAMDPQRFPFGTGRAIVSHISSLIRQDNEALGRMSGYSPVHGVFARAMARLSSVYDASVDQIARAIERGKLAADHDEALGMAQVIKKTIRQSAAAPGFLRSREEAMGVLDKMGQALGSTAQAMRVNGWQGFTDLTRSITLPHGRLAGKLPGNHYGFLPDNLLRGVTALRFTFNPLFEARIAIKQPVLTGTAENLSPELRPAWRMNKLEARVPGTKAEIEAVAARSGLVRQAGLMDESERAAVGGGILGSNLQNHAKFNAWRVYQREVSQGVARGLSAEQADAAAIAHIRSNRDHFLGYKPRAAAEKSVNFVFFPFSFEKKLLGNTAEWLTSEPVRIFLAHHAMKRVDMVNTIDAEGQSKISKFMRRYVPLWREVDKLNAFKHISPGEFGGVYGPLAKTLGLPLEAIRGAFHPVGVSGEPSGLPGLLKRLAPQYRALDDLIHDLYEQSMVAKGLATGTQAMTLHGQLDEYFTRLHTMEDDAIETARSFGATPSVLGFLQSMKVPTIFRQQYQEQKLALEKLYPRAAAYATRFAADAAQDDLLIRQILSKPDKSRYDFGVVAMEAMRAMLDSLPSATAYTPSARMAQRRVVQQGMRNEGLRLYAQLGDAWNQVWQHLGYEDEFGPLASKET